MSKKSNIDLTAQSLIFGHHKEKPYRLTPIILTLYEGVVTDVDIKKFIEMGLQLVRFRMTQVSLGDKLKLISMLKMAEQWVCEKYDITTWPVAICIDFPGAAVRTGYFDQELGVTSLFFDKGKIVTITSNRSLWGRMDLKTIYINDPYTMESIKEGCIITLCSGGVQLICLQIIDKKTIQCECIKEGEITNNEFVTIRGVKYKKPIFLKSDLDVLALAMELKADVITVAVVRNPQEIKKLRKLCNKENYNPLIISTICEEEGLSNFDDILAVSDGIILAREYLTHDMDNRFTLSTVQMQVNAKCNQASKKSKETDPKKQKAAGHKSQTVTEEKKQKTNKKKYCRQLKFEAGKPFFISGNILEQTLSSGTTSTCDISDITNGVLQGCGFLLRKYSNADYLLKALNILHDVCKSVESAQRTDSFWRIMDEYRMPIDAAEACIIACALLIKQTKSSVVVLPTVSGRTAVELTRMAPSAVIITVSKSEAVARRLQVFRGICAVIYDKPPIKDWYQEMEARIQFAVKWGVQRDILTYGNTYVTLNKSSPSSSFPDSVSIWNVTSKELLNKKIKCDHVNKERNKDSHSRKDDMEYVVE